MNRTSNNKIFKSVAIVTLFAVMTRVLSFLFKIYLSRAYGAETVGLYQICLSVLLLLLSVSVGGMPTVLSRKIAEAETFKDFKRQNALTFASIIIGLIISCIIIAICFFMRSHLNLIFSDSRAGDLFLIMLPALISSTIYCSVRAFLMGKKKFFAFSATELLEEILKIVFTALFATCAVSWFSGATAIAVAFLIADCVCALALTVIFFVSGGRFAKPQGFLELSKSSLPLTTLRISTGLVASLTAIIVPLMLTKSGLETNVATALYGKVSGMALPLITAPTTIIGSLAIVLLPDMAKANVLSDNDDIENKLSYSLIFCTFVCSVFFIAFTSLGEEIGTLFFGDKDAGHFVKVCSSLMFLIGTNQTITPVLNSLGLENKTLRNYIVGLLFFIPCILILPKFVGVYAIATANGVMLLISCILSFATLKKRNVKIKYKFRNAVIVLLTVPCILLSDFLRGILKNYLTDFFVIVFCAIICIGIFVTIILTFKVMPINFSFKINRKKKRQNFKRKKNLQAS